MLGHFGFQVEGFGSHFGIQIGGFGDHFDFQIGVLGVILAEIVGSGGLGTKKPSKSQQVAKNLVRWTPWDPQLGGQNEPKIDKKSIQFEIKI